MPDADGRWDDPVYGDMNRVLWEKRCSRPDVVLSAEIVLEDILDAEVIV